MASGWFFPHGAKVSERRQSEKLQCQVLTLALLLCGAKVSERRQSEKLQCQVLTL